MSTDPAEPFYAAIRANPDDDLPRLVFADWLDENSQSERAEYIRLTCAIARQPEGELRNEWKTRAEQLFNKNRDNWFGPLPKLITDTLSRSLKYDRGLISDISLSAALLRAHSRSLELFAPALRRAGIYSVGEMAGEVLSQESIRRLRSLTLSNVTPNSLDRLTAHTELTELDRLTLSIEGCSTAREATRFLHWSLVRSPPSLTIGAQFQTDTTGSGSSAVDQDEQSARFIRDIHLTNIKALVLNRTGPATGNALGDWPGLSRLDELLFFTVQPEVTFVLRSPRMPELKHFMFWNSSLNEEAIVSIATCSRLAKLKTLGLSGARLTDRGVYALISSQHLPSDLHLIVSNNPFSSHAAARLRERFPNVKF